MAANKWTMPDWTEKYIRFIGDGRLTKDMIEKIVNSEQREGTIRNLMRGHIDMLQRLHEKGLLK